MMLDARLPEELKVGLGNIDADDVRAMACHGNGDAAHATAEL